MVTPKGAVPAANCTCTSAALSGGGPLTSTRRRHRLTKWSHPLSRAGRSASTLAWKASYECCPCLMRSDTVSTRRRARRRRADNSVGLVGIRGSDMVLTRAGRATEKRAKEGGRGFAPQAGPERLGAAELCGEGRCGAGECTH